MKIAAKIYTVVIRFFAIAALITLGLLLSAKILDLPNIETPAVTLSRFLQILAFSLPLALAYEIYPLRRLPFIARLAIHYVVTTACFTLLFAVIGNIGQRTFGVIIWIFVFTVLYTVVAAIVLPVLRATGYYSTHLSRIGKVAGSNGTTYENRFS